MRTQKSMETAENAVRNEGSSLRDVNPSFAQQSETQIA